MAIQNGNRKCQNGIDYQYGSIVVLGDSIAQMSFMPGGFAADLVAKYAGKLDIFNRGMAGYTSTQLLYKIRDNPQFPEGVQLFIVLIGTNDCVTSGPQHVPVDIYKSNLISIVTRLKKDHPKAGLVLVTPSVYDQQLAQKHEAIIQLPDSVRNLRSVENHWTYSRGCLESAKELGVPAIDAYRLHKEALEEGIPPEELLPDGVHYTPKGYSLISRALLHVIGQHFPQLILSHVPSGFPVFTRYHQPVSITTHPIATWVEEVVALIEKAQDVDFEADGRGLNGVDT